MIEIKNKIGKVIHTVDADTLEGVNLVGVNLVGANLRCANLEGADLRGVNLNGSSLAGSNLNGANLTGAIIIDCYLFHANLKGAILNLADLRGSHLEEVDLEGARLKNTDLRGACFLAANLTAADLEGANLRGARMLEANLTCANLIDADLDDVNLTRSNLTGVKFRGAKMNGTDFTGANFTGSFLKGAITTRYTIGFPKVSSKKKPEPQAPAIEETQATPELRLDDNPKEMEILCEDKRLRKFINSDGYYWYTDLNVNFVGENIEDSLKNLIVVSETKTPPATSMSDKQKEAIKDSFDNLLSSLGEWIEFDEESDSYPSCFCPESIMENIDDLLEAFPDICKDLADKTYLEAKSYMDEYSKEMEKERGW